MFYLDLTMYKFACQQKKTPVYSSIIKWRQIFINTDVMCPLKRIFERLNC